MILEILKIKSNEDQNSNIYKYIFGIIDDTSSLAFYSKIQLMMQKKKTGKLRQEFNKYCMTNIPVSFNSLSKSRSKSKNVYQSEIACPKSPKPTMLYSQTRKRINTINKQNVRDEYQLFTNMIKSRKESQNSEILKEKEPQSVIKRKNHFVRVNSEYCGQTEHQKIQGRKRSESKHSVQRYFEGKSSLIKKKSDQQNTCKLENLQSPQISLDSVNKSEDSIQFDMSPFMK